MSELYKAIRAVMGDVGYVQKVGKITDNRGKEMYRFAGEAAMLRALRPTMLEHGLCMFPVGCELHETHEILEGKYGPKASRTVRVVSTYRLAHESGEHVDIQVAGEGTDSGDKATAKAMTIALKYAIRQTFLIETGDDPDESRPEREFHDERGVLHQSQSRQEPPKRQQAQRREAAPKMPDWPLLAREEAFRAGATADTIDPLALALVSRRFAEVKAHADVAESFVRVLRTRAELRERRETLPPGEEWDGLADYILAAAEVSS